MHTVKKITGAMKNTPSFCMISMLAEGADRLAALSALKNGGRLLSVLPFPHDVYINDFNSALSKSEFENLLKQSSGIQELIPVYQSKSMSYYQAGKVMLEKSTVLFAVWDGKETLRTGGTSSIVALAKKLNKPVIHINPEHPERIALLHNNAATNDWDTALSSILRIV